MDHIKDKLDELVKSFDPEQNSSRWKEALSLLAEIAGAVANTVGSDGVTRNRMRVSLEGIQLPDVSKTPVLKRWTQSIPIIFVNSVMRSQQTNAVSVFDYSH